MRSEPYSDHSNPHSVTSREVRNHSPCWTVSAEDARYSLSHGKADPRAELEKDIGLHTSWLHWFDISFFRA